MIVYHQHWQAQLNAAALTCTRRISARRKNRKPGTSTPLWTQFFCTPMEDKLNLRKVLLALSSHTVLYVLPYQTSAQLDP